MAPNDLGVDRRTVMCWVQRVDHANGAGHGRRGTGHQAHSRHSRRPEGQWRAWGIAVTSKDIVALAIMDAVYYCIGLVGRELFLLDDNSYQAVALMVMAWFTTMFEPKGIPICGGQPWMPHLFNS
jgi:hypothetical protein